MQSTIHNKGEPLSPIRVSVIVNTCDRAEPLERLLYALNHQTYRNFEVVVVVGPTRDNTMETLEVFAGRIKLIHCPLFNLSASRNMGITAAAGEVIAFIDDDALPSPTWLAQLVDAFSEPAITSAGGKVYQVYPQTGHLQFSHGFFSALADDIDVREPDEALPGYFPHEWWFPRLIGTNMAFRREALVEIGGFDENFAYLFEEPDIAIRLGLRHHQTRHLPEAIVYHAPASGRNREIFTWRINWYAWMRGIIYFTFKNGRPVAGFSPALTRAIQHCLRFFQNIKEYKKDGALPPAYYPEVLGQLWRGVGWGFWHGLFGSRKLAKNLTQTGPRFQPFVAENSAPQQVILPFSKINHHPIKPMSQPSLRICLLSLNYPPDKTDGIARSTHTLAQGLNELGHEVHIIKAGIADRVTVYDGAYVHEVRVKGNRYLKYRQQGYPLTFSWLNSSHAVHECVQSLLTNHNIQIVDSPLYQIEGLVTAAAGIVPVVVRLVTGVRQIIELTGQDNDPDARLVGDLEERLLHLSGGIVANTRATSRAVSTVYNLDFKTLSIPTPVIHYGLKPAPETQVSPLDPAPTETPIILYVGRLEKRKGILDLFTAIPQVLHRFPQAQFWLAGADNSHRDGFKEKTGLDYPGYFQRNFAQYLPQVRFLGYVPDEKLAQLYQTCDLFVAPSLYESFGLIYLEAMNYARPVIGCNVGGPTEIIEDGLTGFLVNPQQPKILAEKINSLLADRSRLRDMGLAGRQRLVDKFSHLAMAQAFAQFYAAVLEQQKNREAQSPPY